MHQLLAAALLASAWLRPVRPCMACGVCPTGGMCGAPPPPQPMCGGCSRGYSCGSYGCFRMRARARSAKTMTAERAQQLSQLTPDEKFMRCCADRALPDACMAKCSYGTYNRMSLQNMYFKLDACPMQAAADIHFCAAQGRDHSDCCYRNGITTTLAGPKCLTLCDQRPGRVTQLDLTYLACFDRFENMKSCFYYDLSTGPGSNEPPMSIPAAAMFEEESEDMHADVDEEPPAPSGLVANRHSNHQHVAPRSASVFVRRTHASAAKTFQT